MGIPWKTQQAGYSAHAVARMQQRGIREDAVDLLFRYGREEHDHRGRTIIYFDKAALRRMKREMCCPLAGPPPQAREGISEGALPQLRKVFREGPPPQVRESFLNLRIYAVLGRSGDIVTVGHRYARIWRH